MWGRCYLPLCFSFLRCWRRANRRAFFLFGLLFAEFFALLFAQFPLHLQGCCDLVPVPVRQSACFAARRARLGFRICEGIPLPQRVD